MSYSRKEENIISVGGTLIRDQRVLLLYPATAQFTFYMFYGMKEYNSLAVGTNFHTYKDFHVLQ